MVFFRNYLIVWCPITNINWWYFMVMQVGVSLFFVTIKKRKECSKKWEQDNYKYHWDRTLLCKLVIVFL